MDFSAASGGTRACQTSSVLGFAPRTQINKAPSLIAAPETAATEEHPQIKGQVAASPVFRLSPRPQYSLVPPRPSSSSSSYANIRSASLFDHPPHPYSAATGLRPNFNPERATSVLFYQPLSSTQERSPYVSKLSLPKSKPLHEARSRSSVQPARTNKANGTVEEEYWQRNWQDKPLPTHQVAAASSPVLHPFSHSLLGASLYSAAPSHASPARLSLPRSPLPTAQTTNSLPALPTLIKLSKRALINEQAISPNKKPRLMSKNAQETTFLRTDLLTSSTYQQLGFNLAFSTRTSRQASDQASYMRCLDERSVQKERPSALAPRAVSVPFYCEDCQGHTVAVGGLALHNQSHHLAGAVIVAQKESSRAKLAPTQAQQSQNQQSQNQRHGLELASSLPTQQQVTSITPTAPSFANRASSQPAQPTSHLNEAASGAESSSTATITVSTNDDTLDSCSNTYVRLKDGDQSHITIASGDSPQAPPRTAHLLDDIGAQNRQAPLKLSRKPHLISKKQRYEQFSIQPSDQASEQVIFDFVIQEYGVEKSMWRCLYPYCGGITGSKNTIKKHTSYHYPIKFNRYQCPFCTYSSCNRLKSHIQNAHMQPCSCGRRRSHMACPDAAVQEVVENSLAPNGITKTYPPKRIKQKYDPVKRRKVAQNRGDACNKHRASKTAVSFN